MATPDISPPPARASRLPVLLWTGLVLGLAVVWGWGRISRATTVTYVVTADGRPAEAAVVQVGGVWVSPGRPVPLGLRTVEVQATDAEPLTERRWIGPGRNDLGEFKLRYRRGNLDLRVIPTPLAVQLIGPHQRLLVTNTDRIQQELIVGEYQVFVSYANFATTNRVTVTAGSTETAELRAKAGYLELAESPTPAAYELRDLGTGVWRGRTPERLGPLPIGTYRLVLQRGEVRQTNLPVLTDQATNRVEVVFRYGTLALASTPAGATVLREGQRLGVTPLLLEEQVPGLQRLRFELGDNEPVEKSVVVVPDQTVPVAVQLWNREAVRRLERAKQASANGDLRQAIAEVTAAVKLEPSHPEAVTLLPKWAADWNLQVARRALDRGQFDEVTAALAEVAKADPEHPDLKRVQQALDAAKAKVATAQTEATVRTKLDEARRLGDRGQYAAALAAVEEALKAAPDSAEALQTKALLLAKQALADAAKRKKRPAEVFETITKGAPDSRLFDTHQWQFNASLATVREALGRAISERGNKWTLIKENRTEDGLLVLQLKAGGAFSDEKSAVVLLGETAENEVVVLAKLWQYAFNDASQRVPIHPQYWNSDAPIYAENARRSEKESFEKALRKALGQ